MALTKEKARYYGLKGGRPLAPHTLDVIEARKYLIARVIADIEPLYKVLRDKALAGDIVALKELLDRSFGKSVQSIAVGDKDGNPIIFMPLELIQKHALQVANNDVQKEIIDVTKDVKVLDNGSA